MKSLSRYSEAAIPTTHGEFQLVVYRFNDNPNEEHIALIYGNVTGTDEVLCRVHSECFTSEVLGSLRCDCREQLDRALERIAGEGAGVLVYLRQEGRGIGLGNKIRAYALQDGGADTVDANLALGFEADLRSYEMAAAILGELDVHSVRLMTNNPAKIEGLRQAGIPAFRESHWVESSAHNEAYLKVKQHKMGHIATSGAHDEDTSRQ